MFGRKQLAILVAEFLGTGVLALVMLSVQHSNIGLPYFVAIAAGLSLVVMSLAMNGNGGAHFNPAITIGMWTVRQIKTWAALSYIVAQMLGAWAAYYLYTYFVKTSLQPIGGEYDGHILVAEAVGALILSLAFAAAVYGKYATSKMAGAVGAAYVLAIMIASSVSFGVVNPAVALSMRAFSVFGSMGWGTYALGPVLGAIIGFNLYALLFAPESSFVRVRAVVSNRLAARAGSSAAASEKPASASKPAAKPAAKRATRTTTSRATKGRARKTTRSRK